MVPSPWRADARSLRHDRDCGASTGMPADRIKPGSIGPPRRHNEVKISPRRRDPGQGRHVFMGYLNQPEKTAETMTRRLAAHRRRRTLDDDGYCTSPTA